MKSKPVMIVSSVGFVVIGFMLLSAPDNVLATGEQASGKLSLLLVQLFGASLMGCGYLNWLARGIVIGGIYGRPLAVGNFIHGLIGFGILMKGVSAGMNTYAVWILLVWYFLYAAGFSVLLFGRAVPVR